MADLLVDVSKHGYDLDLAIRFHGHLGPWLVLGMRIGADALHRLQPRHHFGVTVQVACPLAPPHSCIVDGLQLGTGATYGKRNIAATEGDAITVKVTNNDTNQHVQYIIGEHVSELFSGWYAQFGEVQASMKVFEQPLDTMTALTSCLQEGGA